MNKIFISDADQYVFGKGTHYDIYNKLGSHFSEENGKGGVYFAVWAPNAKEIFVIGEFNEWNETAAPMKRLGNGGIYECFIPGVVEDQLYKYCIITNEGERLYKADPYANSCEFRPGTASKIADITGYKWSDREWLATRKIKNMQNEPMATYECHIGSWMKHPNEIGFYTYEQFADRFVEYAKEMKYTHVELMGIAEYPFDGSWGYQVTGYYAPTSRYGKPKDFMYLIDKLHQNDIGVILDWVPAHFPKDAHGLAEFDGTCLYEHPDTRLGEHPDWGTKIFNYSKNEVVNFLVANALFWAREYHIDGLRVDAVASMLYLDYGKSDGQWVANKFGENKNLEAIAFLQDLTTTVKRECPGVLMIAEESTAWQGVTTPVEEKGLGFDFKWNMGWMHDFCKYMELDPYFRKNNHFAMTFAMTYNNSENYILPLSHDEVVHCKGSMVNKMPGSEADKYANLRLGYTYMFGHSGKKLLFMGQDFAQEREWSEERELDWYLLENPLNKGMHNYVKELLEIYREYPCMYDIDNSWDGFEWMNADDREYSTYTFIRKSPNSKKRLLFVLNMTPVDREDYRIAVPVNQKYKLICNSDEIRFGGTGAKQPAEIPAEKIAKDGKAYSIPYALPGFGAAIFEF